MQIQTQKIQIDPRVIKHLGSDLITSSDVAITELVKNSVDAKSKKIEIHLYDSVEKIDNGPVLESIKEIVPEKYLKSSTCIIEDHGIGMNPHQLSAGFLHVGTSIKAESDDITLGEKGIGRLAAQRLGPALLVETVSCDDLSQISYAFIDWEQVVSNATEATCATENAVCEKSYTRLWIFGVNLNDFLDFPQQLMIVDEPSYECNKELKSSLNFLISPFDSKADKPEIKIDYNGTTVNIDFVEKMLDLSESTHYFELDREKKSLHFGLDISPWYMERIHLAAVKSEAFKRLRQPHHFYEKLLSSQKARIEEVLDRNLNYDELLDYYIKAYSTLIPCPRDALKESYEKIWLDYAQKSLDDLFEIAPIRSKIYSYKQNASIGKDIIIDAVIESKKRNNRWDENDKELFSLPKLKDFLDNYNGIKLYRNYYRIGFLGDKENDWIKLQQFRTKGQQWYRFDLGNTVGFVSVNDPKQQKIREISSRLDIQSGEYSDAFKLFVNIVFNQLFYELNRTADAIVKNILGQEGLLTESISKRVKKNDDAIKKMVKQNKQMLKMIETATSELSAEVVSDGGKVIIPQTRFEKAASLLQDINKQAEENVAVSSQTAQLLAEANEQLKVIEVETYNNFKLMANGLITETITHELHSVSKTSVDESIPEHFDFLKEHFKANKTMPEYNRHVYPIKNGYESILSKIMSVSDLYSFLETTFIKKGTYDEFVPQEINQIVFDVYSNLMKNSTLKNLEIQCNCEGMSWFAPNGVLIHVFYNLFSNSIYWIDKRRNYAQSDSKYVSEDKDSITVEPYGSNNLIVYDSGTGVLPVMQDILFSPLQSGKPKNEGRGMGLYIVKQLMNSFGGEITLLSDLNKYGNRYKFLLELGENTDERSLL